MGATVVEDITKETYNDSEDVVVATRGWHVTFDTVAEAGSFQARTQAGIPLIGFPHPKNAFAWCRDVKAQPRDGSYLIWDAMATYRSSSSSGDPITEEPDIEWNWIETEEPVDIDADGNAIRTTAGEDPNPGLTVPFADLALNIQRNYASWDPFAIGAYRNVTNSDTFMGFPPGTALLKPIRARRIWRGVPTPYWQASIRILFRVDPEGSDYYWRSWYKRWLNQGYMHRPAPLADPVRHKDSEGNDTPSPVMLNVNGVYIPDQDITQAHWNYTKIFTARNFSDLNII